MEENSKAEGCMPDGMELKFSDELTKLAARMVAEGQLLPLKGDIPFKLFLSRKTKASNACLRYMLSALTKREVREAWVTNPDLTPEFLGGKSLRMDVNCIFNDGEQADIELQLKKDGDDQKLRALFYACKLYASTLKEGDLYKTAPNVYQIFLVDFDAFEEKGSEQGCQFYHRAMMRFDSGEAFSERLQILFFNLKVPGTVDKDLHKAACWCKFVSGSNKPEVLSELAANKDWKKEYDMAMNACREISAEQRAWIYHMSVDRAETDYKNEIMLAREDGERQGLEKTARNMLARNYPVADIAEVTGLPLSEVETLAAGQ